MVYNRVDCLAITGRRSGYRINGSASVAVAGSASKDVRTKNGAGLRRKVADQRGSGKDWSNGSMGWSAVQLQGLERWVGELVNGAAGQRDREQGQPLRTVPQRWDIRPIVCLREGSSPGRAPRQWEGQSET